jgi:TolB-like protein/DNA-binding winged helix-turn-helix (wHTH) protein/tetratricopeptide (TPR) repeat protein
METFHGRERLGRVRFGPFEIDLQNRDLTHRGEKVKLQDKPFQILMLLVAEPGKLVTREELRRSLWPANTFVDFEAGLNTAIRKLRDALQDEAKAPRFVETVQRHGYRFIAPTGAVVSGQENPEATAGVAPTSSGRRETSAGSDARVPGAAQDENGRNSLGRVWFLLALAGISTAAVLLLLLGPNATGLRDRVPTKTAERRIQSLAVLPLLNLSGDPTQDYFTDGMTEALITDLGKIGAVRVISRTSAMQYKGTHKTLPQIARELNVDAVLEGSVLRSGNRVRVTAQLLEASTDRHIWAQSYERDLGDVLALQGDLARTVANEIRIKVSPEERTRLANARPVNPEAYEAYLKGRHEWNDWTEEHLQKSVEYLEQAVRKDPGYAPAWAGLSDSYGLLSLFDFLPREIGIQRSKTAAFRALELDDTLSEAHVSLANARLWEWSWSAAEKELQQAIALNPNNAMAHQWYGYELSAMGRFDEAIAEMKRARELDPLSGNKQNSLGATYYRAGRYDDALREFREVADPDANSEFRHRRMAAVYERKGMLEEAIHELVTALKFGGRKELAASVQRKFISSGYAAAKTTFLWGDLREMQRRYKGGSPLAALSIAEDYALLHEQDKAFEWLDKAHRKRDKELMYLKVNDRLEGLQSDPRFLDIHRRVGIP